jgi:hypothetical protein
MVRQQQQHLTVLKDVCNEYGATTAAASDSVMFIIT